MQQRPDIRRVRYYSPNPQRRPIQPQKQRKSKLPLASGIVFGLVVVTLGLHHVAATSGHGKPATVTHTAKIEAAPKPTISETEMATKIQQIIDANPDVDISVSVADVKTGTVIHYGTSAVYEGASVAKLLTAVDYLHEVEKGTFGLNDPAGDSTAQANIQIMIEQSDNTAWQNLNDILTHERLLAYATSIGFANYDPDANTLTSSDIARLEVQLYQGKLLNSDHTKLLLGYMKNANRTDYIKAAIPDGVNFYHKAGWLEDRAHDAAIIDDGQRSYVLVIFTNGHANYHPTAREDIIHAITKATYAHFISSE